MKLEVGQRVIVLFTDCDSCKADCVFLEEFINIEEVSENLPVIYGTIIRNTSISELVAKSCNVLDAMPDDSTWLCDPVYFNRKFTSNYTTGDVKSFMNGFTDYTGKGVVVGILDSGVDWSHPQLFGKIVHNCQTNYGNLQDDNGHGTAVASIIGGNSKETQWGLMEGIAPDVELVNIKVFDGKGDGSFATFIRGLDKAIGAGVDIINYSGGGHPSNGTAIQDVLVNAIADQLNIMVVCPSGNSGARVDSPGSAEESVCVGGLNVAFTKSNFSNWLTVDGRLKPDIVSYAGNDKNQGVICANSRLNNKGLYRAIKGTSFSTPFITGMLAQLMEAKGRRLTRSEIDDIFSKSSSLQVKDDKLGYGLPDIKKAINLVRM